MFEYPEDDPIERQARKDKHSAWLKNEQADGLHANRVELVRRYLQNPSQPLDWPNWKQPHELWFTGHEAYWIPLAKAKQAELDKGISDIKKPITPVPQNPVDTLSTPLSTPSTVDTKPMSTNPPVDSRPDIVRTDTTPEDSRRAYKREWMRKHRASEKPAHEPNQPQGSVTAAST